MTFPSDLIFFSASEFKHADLMSVPFLRWLDRVRQRAAAIIRRYDTQRDVPFVITDDARVASDAEPEGSAGRRSLHHIGCAVDIRSRDWNGLQKWCAAQAIHELSYEAPGGVEFEMVYSKTDRHWHVGVDPRSYERPELIESDE